MGQRQAFTVGAAVVTLLAVGTYSMLDLTKVREYTCISGLTDRNFIKYLEAMDFATKEGHWSIEGELVTGLTLIIGKNKHSQWQFNILAHIGDTHVHALSVVFERETTFGPMMDRRNASHAISLGRDSITRVVKLNDYELESTQTAYFYDGGQSMTLTLEARGIVTHLNFKEAKGDLTAEDLSKSRYGGDDD